MPAVQSAHWYQAHADGDSHQSSGSMVFMLRYPPEWWRHGVHAEIPTRVVEARCSCRDSHQSGPGMVVMPDDKQIWMVQAGCSCCAAHGYQDSGQYWCMSYMPQIPTSCGGHIAFMLSCSLNHELQFLSLSSPLSYLSRCVPEWTMEEVWIPAEPPPEGTGLQPEISGDDG